MREIRVDDQVWERLKQMAVPFEDREPNDVLRRLLNIEGGSKGEHPPGGDGRLSRKALGRLRRQQYLSELKDEGVAIRLAGGVRARLSSGSWVGIPFAREVKPDRWFLGLPERDLRAEGGVFVVLLCQQESGDTFDIVIPPQVTATLADRLSRSKGQSKFNLRKVGSRYELVLRGSEPMDVTGYFRNRLRLK